MTKWIWRNGRTTPIPPLETTSKKSLFRSNWTPSTTGDSYDAMPLSFFHRLRVTQNRPSSQSESEEGVCVKLESSSGPNISEFWFMFCSGMLIPKLDLDTYI